MGWKNMRWRSMGWKKRTGIILGSLILLYTLVGFFVIPMVTEAILPDKLSARLDRPVSVENISLNPYTLTLAIQGFKIGEKSGDEDFVSFDEFFVDIQWISLFKWGLVARELRLTAPFVRVARISEAEFNFFDLIPADKEPSPKEEEPFGGLQFRLSHIQIIYGEFEFHDQLLDKTHRFANVSFTIPVLSNFEPNIDAYALPVLAGELNDTQLDVDVSTKPFAESLETVVDITITGVDLPYYFDYVPVDLALNLTGGNLDIESQIRFKKTPDGKTDLEVSAVIDLMDLQVTDTAADEILAVSSLHVQMAPSRPLEKHIRLSSVSLDEPVVTLVRDVSGNLNLTRLGLQGPGDSEEEEAETGGSRTGSETATPEDSAGTEDAASNTDPFLFEVDKLTLSSGTLAYRDFAAPGASTAPHGGPVQMTVNDLNLIVTGFATRQDQLAEVDLSARVDPDATVSVDGEFGVIPLTVDAAVEVENVPLLLAQPYFPDRLKLVVTSGSFDLSGNARMNLDPESGLSAHFTGDSGIKALTLLERQAEGEFLKWQTLDLIGIDVSWNPTRIRLATLSVNDLKQNLIVQENGRLNMSQIYAAGSAEDKRSEPGQTATPSAPFPVSIGEIKLRNIDISFVDFSIEPNYSARVTFDEGSIMGLSTEAFEGAEVSLKGAVNERAPIDISGRINPLLEDLFLDVSVNLENMELSPVSAYSGKYIGKVIKKGKLNLDLKYSIENKKVEAENYVLLDQFNLGHQVESETDVNLPVGLAIALLKDRKGRIVLNVPVSGRLDDPQFYLTGVIIQSLKDLAVKAATSPFALVSSIVSGGEELRYIEFEAGSTDLGATSKDKLDAIIKLLYERPGLDLELTGFVAPEKDRAALKAAAFEQKVRTAKWVETFEKTETEAESIPFAEITLTEKEYLKYLRQVYKAEVIDASDAPTDVKPLDDESLTADEMAAEIRQRMEIKDARLRLLARNRVESVKGYILNDDRIASKRLFIQKTESLMPSDAGKFKASRVELSLN